MSARASDGKTPRDARWWGSRLALAVLSPLVALAVLEGVVRLVFGPIYYPLPGIDEASHYLHFTLPERFNPLFELREGDDGPRFHTVRDLYTGTSFFARKQSFPAERTAKTVRVAFLGGSSVQGWPYRDEGVVFAELVGAQLQERFPDLRIDVINAGVGTYSSFQLVDVAWQLTAFSPDVAVIYSGHNDHGYYFFNRQFLDEAATRRRGSSGPIRLLNQFRFYRGARLLRDRGKGSADKTLGRPEVIEPEAAFLPDVERGRMEEDGWEEWLTRLQVHEEYIPKVLEANLSSVVDTLEAAGATVVLALPASNLRDFPPVVSVFHENLAPEDRREVARLLELAADELNKVGLGARTMPPIVGDGRFIDPALPWGPTSGLRASDVGGSAAVAGCEGPLEVLDRAMAHSETYARTWYLRGTCLIHSDPDAALDAFVRARDLSPAQAPFQRATSSTIEAVAALGGRRELPVVDVPAAFAAATELGIPDGTQFVDNLHFSALGHRVAADAIVEELAKLEVFRTGPPERPLRTADETAATVAARAADPRWGLNVYVAGASQAYVDGTGSYDSSHPSVDEISQRAIEAEQQDGPQLYVDKTGTYDSPTPSPEEIRERWIEAGLEPPSVAPE